MATRRSGWNELRRLLDSVAVPWFAINSDRKIIWCNEALARATELDVEALQDRKCRYQTPETNSRDEAIADALCPPPEVADAGTLEAVVAWRNTTGEEVRYKATFTSLTSQPNSPPGDSAKTAPRPVAVLAMLHGPLDPLEGKPKVALVANDPSPRELHDQVRKFRLTWGARYHVDRLVGSSVLAQKIRQQVEVASAGLAPVSIVGPEGSGRRHIARTVHYHQTDSHAGRLIHLSAASLTAESLQSAVVGLTSEVPTQASPSTATLLLSDVDALSPDLQFALEQLLEVPRNGIRVVTTAKLPLKDLVATGDFRPNLALCLDPISIELPPLHERREDIPALAQMFVEEFNGQSEVQLGGFEPEALDQLVAYPWPGEIEELRSVVIDACRQSPAPLITARGLPRKIAHGVSASDGLTPNDETIRLDEFLAEIEAEIVRRALFQAKGNKSKAAALLGLTRPRLYRRLVQLGLEEESS